MPRLGRKNTALLITALLMVMLLAWYQAGEEPMRPIEEDIPVPAGVL